MCEETLDISCEVIDLRTLLPWDVTAVGEPATHTAAHLHMMSLLEQWTCTQHHRASAIALGGLGSTYFAKTFCCC